MKKILIVEDDFYISDIYERSFKAASYDVDTAGDGEVAIQKAKNNEYDLILLDIMLPKITGIEVLRTLRLKGANTEETLIFMITNLGQDNIISEAFKIGADGYFIKARLNPNEIVNEINKIFQDKEISSKSH